ncbi:MAG TPA: hypothetical protein VJ464_15890 [Blastocatellia bacterium]|nr:hypothetical protein [Blastocatellia bacterium]
MNPLRDGLIEMKDANRGKKLTAKEAQEALNSEIDRASVLGVTPDGNIAALSILLRNGSKLTFESKQWIRARIEPAD